MLTIAPRRPRKRWMRRHQTSSARRTRWRYLLKNLRVHRCQRTKHQSGDILRMVQRRRCLTRRGTWRNNSSIDTTHMNSTPRITPTIPSHHHRCIIMISTVVIIRLTTEGIHLTTMAITNRCLRTIRVGASNTLVGMDSPIMQRPKRHILEGPHLLWFVLNSHDTSLFLRRMRPLLTLAAPRNLPRHRKKDPLLQLRNNPPPPPKPPNSPRD
mmetsp:Transcript_18757/g.32248  ORF Transcript_18757/g.32248 Transcript_18757/m.32248 type:complete len:212 (-) Transcript_18757:576-1211(-)